MCRLLVSVREENTNQNAHVQNFAHLIAHEQNSIRIAHESNRLYRYIDGRFFFLSSTFSREQEVRKLDLVSICSIKVKSKWKKKKLRSFSSRKQLQNFVNKYILTPPPPPHFFSWTPNCQVFFFLVTLYSFFPKLNYHSTYYLDMRIWQNRLILWFFVRCLFLLLLLF